MTINIKSTNFELTPAIREYVDNKIGSLGKLVSRFEKEGELIANVEVGRTTKHHQKGDVFYAEVNLRMPKELIRINKTDSDLHLAIDEVKRLLAEEIKEYKEKNS